MTTDFSSGAVPAFYRDVFEKCSYNGDPIHRDVYHSLLSQCPNVTAAQLKTIWELAGPVPPHNHITRTNLYKTLALIGLAQQGKTLSSDIFHNICVNQVYPTPSITDLTSVKHLKVQLMRKAHNASITMIYGEIAQLDTITVDLLPGKKGVFLKYSVYLVTSRRFNSTTTRRYNDFLALHELLLRRFPYRIVPRLPPKKVISDAKFLEMRRRGLHRWLTLVCRHPIMYHDALVAFFLTDDAPDCQHRIRDAFARIPDEFTTSDVAATAKTLLPSNAAIAASREPIKALVQIVGRLKYLAESVVEQQTSCAHDTHDMAEQLRMLSALNVELEGQRWSGMQKGFTVISRELTLLASKCQDNANVEQLTICERLALLWDVLIAHKDLCERLEKGLAHDHQVALSKMLALKKRSIQGVIRGTTGDSESVEQLEAKMLTQENVISNMELRSDFSLYCVHMDTQLVYCYLETLSSIFNGLVSMRIRAHSELADVWKQVQPLVQQYLPIVDYGGGVVNGVNRPNSNA